MNLLWTLIGFVAGFAISEILHRLGRHPLHRQDLRETALIVRRGEDGDPEVQGRLVEPSPIPRSLAIILIVVAAMSLGTSVYGEVQRSDDRHHQDVQNCYVTAQVKIRQDAFISSNSRLGHALADLLTAKDRTGTIATITSLRDYYLGRAQSSKTLPPLPGRVIKDCQDGIYDGTN